MTEKKTLSVNAAAKSQASAAPTNEKTSDASGAAPAAPNVPPVPEPVTPPAPVGIEMRVLRDYWPEADVRVRAGTVVTLPVDEAFAAIELGTHERVAKA